LVKIPNKVLRKSILWQQGYFLRVTEGGADMAKLLIASGGVLQTHDVLDHVIIDSAEMCLLFTVILLAGAMNEA
jgi:hypothetical protein